MIRIISDTTVNVDYSWFETFALFWMLYAFFWVIFRCLNFIFQRFGTHCVFHHHRQVGMKNSWGWECWGIYTGKVWFENFRAKHFRKFSSQTFSKIFEPNIFQNFRAKHFRKLSSQTFSKIFKPNIVENFRAKHFRKLSSQTFSKIFETKIFENFWAKHFRKFSSQTFSKIFEPNIFKKFRAKYFRKFSSQNFPSINTPTFSTPTILHTYLPMMMEQTGCSETLEYKFQTPRNYAEENITQMSISLAASILRHVRVHKIIRF